MLRYIKSKEEVHAAVETTLTLMGFTISIEKLVLTPDRELTFLGFKIDTSTQHVTIPESKAESIVQLSERCVQLKH